MYYDVSSKLFTFRKEVGNLTDMEITKGRYTQKFVFPIKLTISKMQ